LIATHALNENNIAKLAKDILPQFGINSYLAIYEIASIGSINFDLKYNLLTLVGIVPDQFDLQQLANELKLSQEQYNPLDTMIRSALVVNTLQSGDGNTKIAQQSTIKNMQALNQLIKTPPLEPPKPPEPLPELKAPIP